MADSPAGKQDAPTGADDDMRVPDAWAFAGWCALAVAFAGAFAWRGAFRVGSWRAFALFDDAMISMRYGQNLAAGDGLVWNPGGERVEGITNPLWTAWMAVLHLPGVHPLKVSLLVTASSLLTILAGLWVARRLAQELAPGDRAVAVVAVGLVATFYPLAFWALSGMEVGLMAWLVGLLALYAVRLEAATGRPRTAPWPCWPWCRPRPSPCGSTPWCRWSSWRSTACGGRGPASGCAPPPWSAARRPWRWRPWSWPATPTTATGCPTPTT